MYVPGICACVPLHTTLWILHLGPHELSTAQRTLAHPSTPTTIQQPFLGHLERKMCCRSCKLHNELTRSFRAPSYLNPMYDQSMHLHTS